MLMCLLCLRPKNTLFDFQLAALAAFIGTGCLSNIFNSPHTADAGLLRSLQLQFAFSFFRSLKVNQVCLNPIPVSIAFTSAVRLPDCCIAGSWLFHTTCMCPVKRVQMVQLRLSRFIPGLCYIWVNDYMFYSKASGKVIIKNIGVSVNFSGEVNMAKSEM